MFHQADDIKLLLSPFDLSHPSVAKPLAVAEEVSTSALQDSVKASLAARANESRLTYDFVFRHGLCEDLEMGFPVLRDKLSLAADTGAFSLIDIYDLGVKSFKGGDIEDAIYAFFVLTSRTDWRVPALSALAACACFQEAYGAAMQFAQESIAYKETVPRTYLIAGYSALKSGDKKTAKRHLALATRLARGDVRYRDEQRCAQRELLLMQLTS